MPDRLTDEQVAQWARYDGAYDAAEVSALAREVQESRKVLDAIDALPAEVEDAVIPAWYTADQARGFASGWADAMNHVHRILHPEEGT